MKAAYIQETGDALAYRWCHSDWYNDGWVMCELQVRTSDGVTTLGTEGSFIVDNNWHAWSPDGAKIAFVSADYDYVDGGAVKGDIIVADIAEGSFVNLTANSATDNSPDWSPDGGRIAFLSDRDGQPEIYAMNAADGSNLTRLTNGVGVTGGPSWSPDGTRLTFTCVVESGNSDLCAINADGSGFERLTTAQSNDANPDFSPDGARLAFVSDGELRFLNLADGSISAPANRVLISQMRKPDWSPSGDRIAFAEPPSGAQNADQYYDEFIIVVNADGSGKTSADNGTAPGWRPTAVAETDTPPVAEFYPDCNDLQCYFHSTSTDDHGIVTYYWTFGDGSYPETYYIAGHNFPAAGTYNVTLVVTDWKGQTSSVTHAITVGPPPPPDSPPVANFTASCSTLTCAFDSGASTDDHGIVSRSWTFGDGTSTADIVAPSHSYGAGGTYAVTLTVVDGLGQTTSNTHNVTVVDQPPVAQFTYVCNNKASCTFDGPLSNDDIGIVSYTWNLGGGTATGAVVTASFRHNSTQTITLTVKDAANQASSTAQTITVK